MLLGERRSLACPLLLVVALFAATLQGHAEDSHQQAPDVSRESGTRPTRVEDGRKIEACHWALLQKQPASKAAGCPESLVHASGYYIALRDAALTGDVNAQKCFLAGYFNDRDAGDGISDTQRKEYLSLARRFIQSAFERGDWALVHRLAGTYVDNPGLLIHVYPYGTEHPDTMYKMNYLLTLGSGDGAGSDAARNTVSAIRRNGGLSAQQIQAAEDWARETYSKYFARTPYNEKAAASSFCQKDLN